jgi:hypothetical protein
MGQKMTKKENDDRKQPGLKYRYSFPDLLAAAGPRASHHLFAVYHRVRRISPPQRMPPLHLY